MKGNFALSAVVCADTAQNDGCLAFFGIVGVAVLVNEVICAVYKLCAIERKPDVLRCQCYLPAVLIYF